MYKNGDIIKNIYKRILPAEYQQVEYIQSYNVPTVNLGITGASLGGALTVEAVFQIYQTVTASGNSYIMGSGSTTTGRCLNVGVNASGGMLLVGNEYGGSGARTINLSSSDVNIYAKNEYKFVLKNNDRNELHVNGNVFYAPGNCSNVATDNIRLFNGLNGGTFPYLRLFSFKLYNSSGELLFDLIPCYKKVNNNDIIGLYNMVNGDFLVNTEGGALNKGSNSSKRDKIDRIMKNGERIHGLPEEYQEVAYIKTTSDGGQYIDTGIASNNNNLKIKVKYAWSVRPTSGGYQYIIGAYVDENTNTTRILQYNAGTTYVNINKKAGGGTTEKNISRTAGTIYKEELTPTYYDINGTKTNITTTTSGTANDLSLYLFWVHNPSGTSTAYAKSLILYECSIYDGNTPKRCYIPCYRKSDREPGLYDIVTDTFYTNNGTGAFNYGI